MKITVEGSEVEIGKISRLLKGFKVKIENVEGNESSTTSVETEETEIKPSSKRKKKNEE